MHVENPFNTGQEFLCRTSISSQPIKKDSQSFTSSPHSHSLMSLILFRIWASMVVGKKPKYFFLDGEIIWQLAKHPPPPSH